MSDYVKYKRQEGAALITALAILLVMTLLVLSSVQGTIMNSHRVKNVQTNSFVRRAIEGEILAQTSFFALNNAASDGPVIQASDPATKGLPVLLNNISNIAGLNGLSAELRDLTDDITFDPANRQIFGQLCGDGEEAGVGCKHMLLTVRATHPQVGQIVQHIGFGYKEAGEQGKTYP